MCMALCIWRDFRQQEKFRILSVRCLWLSALLLPLMWGRTGGAGENGPRQTGSASHTDDDTGVQCGIDGSDSFLWKVYDIPVY